MPGSMPRPRRREAALAPACWNSLWGQRAAPPAPGQSPFPRAPSCGRTGPSPPWHGASHGQPRTAGVTLGWPPRRSSSRAGRRGPPSGARGLPKPTDTNAQALGQRRKQQHSSCPCCSSQRALGLQWCQGGVNSAAGTGWSHPGRCKGTVLAVLSLRLCNDLSEVSALPYGQ